MNCDGNAGNCRRSGNSGAPEVVIASCEGPARNAAGGHDGSSGFLQNKVLQSPVRLMHFNGMQSLSTIDSEIVDKGFGNK